MPESIESLLKNQDAFIKTFQPRDIHFRMEQLKRLKKAVQINEQLIYNALWKDLHKSKQETYASELGFFYNEISLYIRNLKKWAKVKKVATPIICFPSSSHIQPIPFGRVLIIGAFNFPFQLCMVPLAGAMAAGNTIVLKPSELSSHTSAVITKIIGETFNDNYVAVLEGGVETNQTLLTYRWDLIFFTGSQRVGKIVMEAASKHLTPVVLELGGKNPAIIDKKCDLKVAAKRVAWGKFYNAGQSCVAIDYVLIHKEIRDKFLQEVKKHVVAFYSDEPEKSEAFLRIVNSKHTARLKNLINSGTIFMGGQVNEEENYVSPTILIDVLPESPVMQEEIFGPVLPVLTFSSLDEAIAFTNEKEKPLAAYIFSSDKKIQQRFLCETSSGDGAINDSVLHFINHNLPFGGIGQSGIGSGYHGKYSFDVFSHKRSVLKTTTLFDLPLRYPPYKKFAQRVIRFLLK